MGEMGNFEEVEDAEAGGKPYRQLVSHDQSILLDWKNHRHEELVPI